eukprot:4291892-Amphidinium_carterae.1
MRQVEQLITSKLATKVVTKALAQPPGHAAVPTLPTVVQTSKESTRRKSSLWRGPEHGMGRAERLELAPGYGEYPAVACPDNPFMTNDAFTIQKD